jgi:hypothetical protein
VDRDFINILKRIVAEQGKAALTDAKRGRAFISDYTGNEYKKEKRLFLLAVEAGMAKAIDEADDLEACKKTYIRELDDDYALDTDVAEDIINTLALLLHSDKTRTISPLAEKAAAEKIAADRTAAEKAAAEMKAAERAAVEKAIAERDAADRAAAVKAAADRAAARKAAAAKRAADRVAARNAAAAKRAAARNAAASRKAARRSSSSSNTSSPFFAIVDRDSGDGSSILLGIIGAVIGLGVGSLIGGFIGVIVGGVLGWSAGSEIGKSVYVNLRKIILIIVIGVVLINGVIFIVSKLPSKPKQAAAQTAQAETRIVSADVNLRAEPSGDAQVIKILKEDDTVTLTGSLSGGWTQVRHEGDTGWMSSHYFK